MRRFCEGFAKKGDPVCESFAKVSGYTGSVKANKLIREMSEVKTSERVGRAIDHDTDGSMEDKKREGYF